MTKSPVHQNYINQGHIGDCYFITSLTRIAKNSELVQTLFEKQRPDEILGSIADSINIKCGAVVVYFRVFGQRTPVLIDTLIPFIDDTPVFSHPINTDMSAWFCLVEKAFAKLNGSFSNIVGGFFSESFYKLFGYYNKRFDLTKDTTKNTFKMLTYQKCGCLMDASIPKDNPAVKLSADKCNLVTRHSYLITKIRKYNDTIFFLLRNPWGEEEWNGDYSKCVDGMTSELETFLNDERKNGQFWLPAKVFFFHYDTVDVSKPIDPHWTTRSFNFKIQPSMDSGYDKLDQHPNFAFKLIDDIPPEKKARVRIFVEKRNIDYEKFRLEKNRFYIYAGRNGGKKLKSYQTYECSLNCITLSMKVTGKNDIVTFAIVHLAPEKIEADCYVSVFCEFDFDLYNVDHPENLFPRGETGEAYLDNFSISAPNAALVLERTIINGKYYLWLKNPTFSNFDEAKRKALELMKKGLIIENLIKKTKEPIISGSQINVKKFIYNNELIYKDRVSNVYSIIDKETHDEYAAIVNRESLEFISKRFSKKVSVMMKLKYPSIINFVGFNENGFSSNKNPVIITDIFKNGTLFDNLSDLTNTQKMINLIGIAFGMNHIHKHGIIHCGLSCSSILLDDNMHPKIADFNDAIFDHGCSNFHEDEQFFQSLPLCFIAPEFIHGSKPYSFPVDVFSYGMLFFQVISGEEPMIDHTSKDDFFIKINRGELPDLDEIPTRHHAFISSMWDKDPEKRPNFEEIIKKLLFSRYECWLEEVDENEIECYIHQFGATLKKQNRSEYLEIINNVKKNLPASILCSVNDLQESNLAAHKTQIIDIAKVLYKNDDSLGVGIELANIAADLNTIEAFVMLGKAYKEGRGVVKNEAMAAVNFKIAADCGNECAMFEYASILMNFFNKTIGSNEKEKMLNEGREIIANLTGKSNYFYVGARLCFDTIENREASLFAAKRYLEKASKKGHKESNDKLNSIKNQDSINLPYFEELCQDIPAEMINI